VSPARLPTLAGPAAPRATRPRVVPSLAHGAVDTLRRLIVTSALAPGTALTETQLVARLGVSRTPIREALKLLSREGLVLLRRNRAAIVAPLDGEGLHHLFEAEAMIESTAAGLAAQRRPDAAVARLERLQERMEAAEAGGDREAYIRINQQVHALIVQASGNTALVEMHQGLMGRLQRARNVALAQQGRVEESILEHRAILDALRRRDGAAARRLMGAHVERTGDIVAAICRTLARPDGSGGDGP
jgi:DNA-binding GntR family transcriptional regulator